MIDSRGGAGSRAGRAARRLAAVLCATLLAGVVACSLQDPVSPNPAANLTGQATNRDFTFNGTIDVFSAGSSLIADDTNTVQITATVRDAAGNPIPNLAQVTFSANLGGFVTGVDADNAPIVASPTTAPTFNGLAHAHFISVGGVTGTATIVASLGTVAASARVRLAPAPLAGAIQAAFGTDGSGATSMTGAASAAAPLDVDISAQALDDATPRLAIAGATVRFRIVADSTDTASGSAPAEFIAGLDEAFTNGNGVAATKVRVRGAGDLVMVADLVDRTTGAVVATSNSIVLVTTAGSGGTVTVPEI